MTATIERLEPHEVVESAAALLDQAWLRPCFHYSAEYLAWQFGYPSPLPPSAVGAFEGSRLVGFVGLCARRVRIGGFVRDVYIISFGSVLPQYQGRGIASRIYEAILRGAESTGADVMAFAESGSPAESVFAGVARRVRSVVATLPPLRGCAAAAPAFQGSGACADVTHADLERLLLVATRDAVALNDPTEAQMAHYAKDPRGAAFLMTEDDSGCAGALATLYEVANSTGVERVPVLDSVLLPSCSARQLKHLAAAASRAWSTEPASVVLLPNAGVVDAAVLREAGFRHTKASFTPYILSNDSRSPLLAAEATNLEII